MKRLRLGLGVVGLSMIAACGGGGGSSGDANKLLRFSEFELHWSENAKMDLGEIPTGSVLEVHPTYIIVDMKDGWRTLIPMDRIRFMNLKKQL